MLPTILHLYKSMHDAVLVPYVVMAVPMHVLVSIGTFPLRTRGECSIMFWHDQYFKEWHRTIFLLSSAVNVMALSMLLI